MQQLCFPYELSLKTQMPDEAQELLNAAQHASEQASAACACIKAGAALLLTDGSVLAGSGGQEQDGNADGTCAARAVLGMHDTDGVNKVRAIAIAWKADGNDEHRPSAPCGICRQSILDVQLRQGTPITVYMGAADGEVIMVEDAGYLLPFYSGSAKDL